MKTKFNLITKRLLLLFFVLLTSITLAQSKETISGTFFNIYYPNGEHLLSNAASHTIPAHKGHIEVTVPPGVIISMYQKQSNGGNYYVINNFGIDRSKSQKYIITGYYGGPDYIINMQYPDNEMINKTIVYNIDFYYYNTIYSTDIEPNDTKETAVPMSENTSYEGWGRSFGEIDSVDYYKVTAQKRGTYTIVALSHASTAVNVNNLWTVLQYEGSESYYKSTVYERDVKFTLKIHCVDKGEEFYISARSGQNSYKLNYTVEESLDENDIEPNDTFESAIELPENSIGAGTIGYGKITSLVAKDPTDFYKITPPKNGKLIVNFKEKFAVKGNFVSIYEKLNNQNVLREINYKDLNDYNQTFEIDCASKDKTYYLKVYRNVFDSSAIYSCCNAYEVSWSMLDTANANCVFLSTTDFENTNGVNIYPNPTTSILYIQTSDNAIIDSVTLFDLTGKIILQQTKSSNQINVESLASGTYIVEAYSGKDKFTSKFVKK
jgi:hypothetical protein